MDVKLTTAAACEVVGLHRDRFNEHVAAGYYGCAPGTIPGRARSFNPDDMLSLFLFKRIMDDGLSAERAGTIACMIGATAKELPEEPVLAYVETYVGVTCVMPGSKVPASDSWHLVMVSGSDIRKVTMFNVAKTRSLIAHYTAEYASTIGPRD